MGWGCSGGPGAPVKNANPLRWSNQACGRGGRLKRLSRIFLTINSDQDEDEEECPE